MLPEKQGPCGIDISLASKERFMRVLIASSGIPGHLNPLLSAASILQKHDHEVKVMTSVELKPVVEAAGLPFMPEIPDANSFVGSYINDFPERQEKKPGMEMTAFDLEHYFARMIPVQASSLELALREFKADVVLVDSLFWGTLPMLLGAPENRPVVVHLGITILNLGSGENIPERADISEDERRLEREQRKRVMLQPAQAAANQALAKVDCGPLPCPVLAAMSVLPDLYLHPGIEGFEYPGSPAARSRVRYIGSMPTAKGHIELPDWWREIDKSKKVVLITQGTIANRDFGQLIGPALVGLAEEDLILLVTTGGQPIESIPVELPPDARVASFLPFDVIMPHVDLLISNGGYGTINMALSHGIPVISAGLTEDKEEVSAHVQWAGVGIDLRTNQATPEAVYQAVLKIFDDPKYRHRAEEFAREFAHHNAEEELLGLIESCVEHKNNNLVSVEVLNNKLLGQSGL